MVALLTHVHWAGGRWVPASVLLITDVGLHICKPHGCKVAAATPNSTFSYKAERWKKLCWNLHQSLIRKARKFPQNPFSRLQGKSHWPKASDMTIPQCQIVWWDRVDISGHCLGRQSEKTWLVGRLGHPHLSSYTCHLLWTASSLQAWICLVCVHELESVTQEPCGK